MPPASASVGAFPPDLSPTTTTLHSGSSADGLFPLLPPASADADRFAYRRDPRDPREPFFPEPEVVDPDKDIDEGFKPDVEQTVN